MKRSWWYRFVILLILVGISVFVLIPTVFNYGEDSHYPVKSKISLGLDLQGGLYMVLGIDFNKVYRDEVKGYARKIQYTLNDDGITSAIGTLDDSNITDPVHSVTVADPSKMEEAKEKIRKFFPSIIRLTHETPGSLSYGLTKVEKTRIEEQSVSKSIEVIRNRIDEFGVTEPEIVSQGKDRIIVALPGVKDIDRAKELIGKTAKLTFKIVNSDVSAATMNGWVKKAEESGIVYKKGVRFSSYLAQMNKFLVKDIPKGYELAFEKKVSKFSNEIESKIPYVVEANPKLTGDALQDARVQIDQQKKMSLMSL